MSSEKFCLRWNDFESNISVAFRELRDDKDFLDVTLACDDEQIQAHKMILGACSPFFRNILRRNPHQHPLLYLKGVKYNDLQSVLNFMYHGEVSVAREDLNSFLSVAEDLRVKGLTQNQPETTSKKTEKYSHQPKPSTLSKVVSKPPPKNQDQFPVRKHPQHPRAAFPPPIQPMDDDIQEVVPVKTEPRGPPPPAAASVLPPAQDVYATTTTHSLAHVEDVYQDEQEYNEYQDYEDEQQYGAATVTDYDATEGIKDGEKLFYISLFLTVLPILWYKQSACMALGRFGGNVVSTFFLFFLSWVTYFPPRRGCSRVLKCSMGS
jgi:hypothetical protein